MAGTLSNTLTILYSNTNGDAITITAPSITIAVANSPRIGPTTVSVATSDQTLAIGTIGTIGLVFVQNLDPTNYIEVGPSSTYSIKVPPASAQSFYCDGWTALHAKANTGACLLTYAAFSI